MVPLGDEAQVEARFGPFGDKANHTQDRCMVCVERTIGSDIILDTPDGTPRWVMWHLSSFCLETVLVPVQDGCMACARRTIGLEVILRALDGTSK